jgi:PX domain
MSLSIKIKEYETVGEHIEYIVEVYDKVSGDTWKFRRRYSYLRNFHKQLKSLDSRLPEFPPKKVFGSKNPRFLEQRRSELENYFNALVKIPKLMEHNYTKDLLKPQDLIILKNSPAQPVTPYKKPKQGPEMKSFVDKLNETVSTKFFDLSAQPVPPEDEEIRRQMKVFENLIRNIKVAESFKLPEGSHINAAYHKTTVVRQPWTVEVFEELVKIAENSEPLELLISFK